MIDLKSAEVHHPLFLSGTNLGLKLDPAKRTGLKLQFDEETRELHAWFNGNVKIIQNWADIEPMNYADMKLKEPLAKVTPLPVVTSGQANPKIQAQVSGPHSHVFANEPGQTGQSKTK